MKFKSPDGRAFCSMQEAKFDFCATHNCIDCALEKHANEQGETCGHYTACHPDEAALLPVSREQVERMRGEWISTGAISCKCSRCNHLKPKYRVDEYNCCPYCMESFKNWLKEGERA